MRVPVSWLIGSSADRSTRFWHPPSSHVTRRGFSTVPTRVSSPLPLRPVMLEPSWTRVQTRVELTTVQRQLPVTERATTLPLAVALAVPLVTVSLIANVPSRIYTWVTVWPVPLDPSPKSQLKLPLE